MESDIILVDTDDNQIGTAEKIQTHKTGLLHRAFSIFVFNSKGELLLQKRAKTKYHTPGLWTNTCCSHPIPGENILENAEQRLKKEMGFECNLQEKFSFIYKAELDQGLTEHEFDHVFIGIFNGQPHPDPEEVEEFAWLSLDRIRENIKDHPEKYTFWFKSILEQHSDYLNNGKI